MNPSFSVVVPLFKVEEYIQDLLDSFSKQEPGGYSIEYIFIDDGSPDRSGDIVEQWILHSNSDAQLVRQENQGVSAARNRGIELARGNWITFPDSDDFLDTAYFKNVAQFLHAPGGDDATIIAANIVRYFDKGRIFKNSHALRFKFAQGNAVVDLDQNPNFIQLSAPTTFYRTAELRTSGVRFQVGLHASEDALFTSQVLLGTPYPKLGVVANARYFYRKRASEDSAVDTFKQDANTYFERFEAGYEPLIQQAIQTMDHVPRWLVSLILYEYRWLFLYETKLKSKATVLSKSQQSEFIALTQRILANITPGQIEDYRVTPMQYESRLVLQALAGETFPNQGVRVVALDSTRNLVKVTYWFTGEPPVEQIRSYGQVSATRYAKTRTLDYFGQTALRERILWVDSANQLEVLLDGQPVRISYGLPALRTFQVTEQSLRQRFGIATPSSFRKIKVDVSTIARRLAVLKPMGIETNKDVAVRGANSLKRRAGGVYRKAQKRNQSRKNSVLRTQLLETAKNPETKMKFKDAWVLMDRVDVGGDSAEHLYRYLNTERPEINAWFALNRSSKDWERLAQEGFKLLEYGGPDFQTALVLSQNLISTHADIEMTEPMPESVYPGKKKPWKFIFLQHGVIQSDLSGWLNQKEIDLFITTTRDEYESIAGDNTPYIFSAKDTVLTGLPRHDRLVEMVRTRQGSAKYLLISPTWRHFLVQPKVIGSGEREAADSFYESDFFRNWNQVLTDPRLFEIAERAGLQVAFLPHPNLEAAMATIPMDPRIKKLTYREGDVQSVFANTGVLITDYSSIAFDLALAGAEVHYFQFDRKDMYGGKHTMAPGYYDHEIHGFGPVHQTSESLLEAGDTSVCNLSETLRGKYADRVEAAFVFRNGGASERIVKAIEGLR